MSGRPEPYRNRTKIWLESFDIKHKALFMRSDGDFRDDTIVKEELYRKFVLPDYDVAFVVDDRKKVVDMWRRLGLVCLQCAEGNF